jgi:molybdopterin synthase sulfur carrier subunit
VRQVLQGGEDLLRPPGPAGQAGELGHPISSEAGIPWAAVDGRAPYHSDMVRIRLFAALREAAGVAEVEARAAPLQAILDELGDRFGDRFVAVLGYSSVLVDGERWRDPSAPVPDGAELALLPPFSGGA